MQNPTLGNSAKYATLAIVKRARYYLVKQRTKLYSVKQRTIAVYYGKGAKIHSVKIYSVQDPTL